MVSFIDFFYFIPEWGARAAVGPHLVVLRGPYTMTEIQPGITPGKEMY